MAALLIIGLAPMGVALFHDIHRSFITTSDGDIVYIYEALRLNDGLPQHYHVHTGYTLFVLLSAWIKLMAWVGLVPVSKLNQLPAVRSEDFQLVYAQLVVSGRWFAAILSGVLALTFVLTIRLLTGRPAVAVAAGLVFAFSPPLGSQALRIFTELPSTLGLLASLACIAAASRTTRPWVLLFAAGLAATLGLMSKMQGIFIAVALPVLALPLARRGTLRPMPQQAWALGLLAGAVILVGLDMVVQSVVAWGKHGAPQAAVVALAAGCIWVYGAIEDSPRRDRLLALLAVGAGISVALQLHLLHHNMVVVHELVNFFDNLFLSASLSARTGGAGPSVAPLVGLVFKGLLASLHHHFLAPTPLTQPLDLLNFAAVALAVVLAIRRQWRPAIQVVLFTGLAICIEAAFLLYQTHLKTAVYVDIWLITAVAIGAAALLPAWTAGARRAVLAAIAVLVGLEVSALASPAMVWTQPVDNACTQAEGYMHEIKDGFARYCKPIEEPNR